MNLYLELTTFPTELAESSFVYELYKNSETMAIASGNFANKKEGDTITLLSNQILNTSKDEEPLNLQTENIVYLHPIQFTGSWQASTSIFPFARHAASIAISTPPPAAN